MEDFSISEIVAKVKQLDLKGPVTDDPDDLEPTSMPLNWIDWCDPSDSRRWEILAKVCGSKPEIDLLCSMCTNAGTSRCGAYGARYCSKYCRDTDWSRHRIVCKRFAGWDYTTRPSKDHYLAIILPTDQKEPELVWYRFPDDATELEVTHRDIHRLRHRDPRGRVSQINSSVTTGRVFLGHGVAILDVYGLTDMERDGLLNMNKTINSLARPGSLAFYSGPHMILAFECKGAGKPGKGIDVSPRDWRHATDYIIFNPKNPSINVVVPDAVPSQFATRINNTASLLVRQIHRINEEIQSVVAPVSYWSLSGPCSLAFQLGLPWKTRCVLGSELAKTSDNLKYLSKYFRRQPRPGGDASVDWVTTSRYKCGSIVVMSAGKRRIVHQHHIIAFNKYLDYSLKKCIVPSKKGFMAYWEKYVGVTSTHTDIKFVAHPYHILPRRDEFLQQPGESEGYRNAVINLLGHFSSRGYEMQVSVENGRMVPVDVVAPYDAESRFFEFTAEERDIPSGSYGPFGNALRGTREEAAGVCSG